MHMHMHMHMREQVWSRREGGGPLPPPVHHARNALLNLCREGLGISLMAQNGLSTPVSPLRAPWSPFVVHPVP